MKVNLVNCALLKKAAFSLLISLMNLITLLKNKLVVCYVSVPNIVFQHHE